MHIPSSIHNKNLILREISKQNEKDFTHSIAIFGDGLCV